MAISLAQLNRVGTPKPPRVLPMAAQKAKFCGFVNDRDMPRLNAGPT